MPEVHVPVIRSIHRSLDARMSKWGFPTKATNGERVRFLVEALLGPIARFANRNPASSETFKPHVLANGSSLIWASIESKKGRKNWRRFIAATNVVLGRVDLALKYGATIDDVLLAVYEREGVKPEPALEAWIAEHGRREIVCAIPLEELIFG